MRVILFVLLSIPFICMMESFASFSKQAIKTTVQSKSIRKPPWKVGRKKVLKPQYESCKEVDLSSLDLEEISPSSEDTTATFCFSCSIKEVFGFGELKETAQAIRSKTFMDKLRKRVIGQIESKIFQTKVLHACATGDRNWLSRQKVDWLLMKAVCKQKNKQLKISIKTRWTEMRVNLALSQVNPDQIVTGKPHLSFSLSHAISDFSSIPKLTEKEQKLVKKRWADRLAKTPLDKLTPSEFKAHFLKGEPSKLSTKDRRKLRKSAWKMQKEAKDSYFEMTSEMPLLGYLKTGNPGKKELKEAFTKMEENLKDLLKEAKDSEGNEGLLLSFKPLVEELLKEDKDYCLVAEKARIKAEKDESLKNWMMLGAGVLAAVPCFITGPVGASVCLTAGVALGVVGYKEAQTATKKSLGRALTGKQFETMAGLDEKEKEELLAKLFLPLGAWGTTAVPARAASGAIAKAMKGAKTKTGSSKGAGIQTDPTDVKAVLNAKPHINPDDVHIKKTGYNADTQADIFQMKFTSSNNKEIQFDLEISKKRLKQNKLDIEKGIKDVIEFEELDAEEAERYAAFLREEEDLLLNIQRFISRMSEESFQRGDKISLEELESMLISQYKNRVFQNLVQNYSRQHNSKLSHIGVENVRIKKVGDGENFTEYDVQFKTQKGKKMSLKLEVSKDADIELTDDFVVNLIKENEFDQRVLTMAQKMQLAIGQMPAEIFKGLKSITIQGSKGEMRYAGQVGPVYPGMLMVKGTAKSKYALHNLPPRLAVRFPINDSVVHAWMRVTKSTKSHMDLSIGRLNDIPLSSDQDLTSVLAHELGHVLQNTQYSIPTMRKIKFTGDTLEQMERMKNPKGWPDAIKQDGTSVSKYGDTKLSEDFAEAMRVYIQTDGGTKDPQALKDFANRFGILDSLMKKSMKERKSLFSKFKKVMEKKGVAFVTSSGVLTHIVVQDKVYITPTSEDISITQ